MLQLHLEKLRHFVGVARAGSIRGYAVKENLSQPAISKAMQNLESVLESSLLIRAREGIQLTGPGQLLFEWAERLLNEADQIEIKVRSQNELVIEGNFYVGTYQSIAVYFIPQFYKFLQKTQRNLKINLVTAPSHELIQQLRSGELDIAISVDPPKVKGLIHARLFDDTYSLYRNTQGGGRLGKVPIFTLETARDAAGTSLLTYLKATPWSKSLVSCGDFEAAKAMLEADVGFALLPDRVALPLVEQKKAERVKEANGLLRIGLHGVYLSFRSHREADVSIRWISRQIELMMRR